MKKTSNKAGNAITKKEQTEVDNNEAVTHKNVQGVSDDKPANAIATTPIDEALSDGSGGAFGGTEEVKE